MGGRGTRRSPAGGSLHWISLVWQRESTGKHNLAPIACISQCVIGLVSGVWWLDVVRVIRVQACGLKIHPHAIELNPSCGLRILPLPQYVLKERTFYSDLWSENTPIYLPALNAERETLVQSHDLKICTPLHSTSSTLVCVERESVLPKSVV